MPLKRYSSPPRSSSSSRSDVGWKLRERYLRQNHDVPLALYSNKNNSNREVSIPNSTGELGIRNSGMARPARVPIAAFRTTETTVFQNTEPPGLPPHCAPRLRWTRPPAIPRLPDRRTPEDPGCPTLTIPSIPPFHRPFAWPCASNSSDGDDTRKPMMPAVWDLSPPTAPPRPTQRPAICPSMTTAICATAMMTRTALPASRATPTRTTMPFGNPGISWRKPNMK